MRECVEFRSEDFLNRSTAHKNPSLQSEGVEVNKEKGSRVQEFKGRDKERAGRRGCFFDKPDPQCVSIILERLRLEPGEALYVGDSDVDRETAARAGTPFAAYRNTSLKADLHLPDHAHLLKVLMPGY